MLNEKKITGIFKKENFTLSEYYARTNERKKTNRLKLEVIDKNTILLNINMGGKDAPSFTEVLLKLPKPTTGEIVFVVESVGPPTLSCLDLSTKSNEIGRDIRLYMGRFATFLNLKNDTYISFKFTHYTNYDRSGKIKIMCI